MPWYTGDIRKTLVSFASHYNTLRILKFHLSQLLWLLIYYDYYSLQDNQSTSTFWFYDAIVTGINPIIHIILSILRHNQSIVNNTIYSTLFILKYYQLCSITLLHSWFCLVIRYSDSAVKYVLISFLQQIWHQCCP